MCVTPLSCNSCGVICCKARMDVPKYRASNIRYLVGARKDSCVYGLEMAVAGSRAGGTATQ